MWGAPRARGGNQPRWRHRRRQRVRGHYRRALIVSGGVVAHMAAAGRADRTATELGPGRSPECTAAVMCHGVHNTSGAASLAVRGVTSPTSTKGRLGTALPLASQRRGQASAFDRLPGCTASRARAAHNGCTAPDQLYLQVVGGYLSLPRRTSSASSSASHAAARRRCSHPEAWVDAVCRRGAARSPTGPPRAVRAPRHG